MRRACFCVLLLTGCGGGSGHPRAPAAPLPAPPLQTRHLTGAGRIVIVNGWRGAIAGQRLTVAAGRYAVGSRGVAVVSDAADLEREVPAPDGEGALRYVRRTGAKLVLRSRAGHAFALDLRTLRLERRGAPPPCPRGALASPRPRLALRETRTGLRPLPAPQSDGFAVLLAILARAGGRVVTIEARPAAAAPCGLAARSVAARVTLATPRPIVSVVRRTFLVARFRHGWRVWRVWRTVS